MRHLILITLLSAIIMEANAAGELKTKSKVTEATVFFTGVEVTHESKAQLQKGTNELLVQGLSPNIDRNSIRVKASNGVLISSFEFLIEPLENGETEIKKMQDSINDFRTEITKIHSELKINENFLEMLQKSVDKTVAGGENGLGVDDLIKTMDYYDKKIKETEASSFKLRAQEKDLNTKIGEVNTRISLSSQKSRQSKGALKLSLSSPAAVQCTFHVSYYTPYASWTPFHDINVINVDSPVKVTSKAKVTQTTGIEWEQIKLKLSTSVPSFGKTAPLFTAWILLQPVRPVTMNKDFNFNIAAQNSASYKRTKNAEIAMEIEDVVDYKDEMQATMDNYVTLTENTINETYDIDLPYTIPGNGNLQNIDLRTQEIKGEFKSYCAPRLDPNTFLIAEIMNWEKLNLLSGKANITYDGTFVGESYINAASTQDALTLTLGIDRRVAVKREKINEMSSSKLLGSDTKQDFTYRLTVRNNNNRPINLVLKDQYPISTQKQVEVTLNLKETTTPTFNKEEVGVLTWEEVIAAGESKIYVNSYTVKYPKNTSLNL